jgi:hypothetical protein
MLSMGEMLQTKSKQQAFYTIGCENEPYHKVNNDLLIASPHRVMIPLSVSLRLIVLSAD